MFTPDQLNIIEDALVALVDDIATGRREPWLDYAAGPLEDAEKYTARVEELCQSVHTHLDAGTHP